MPNMPRPYDISMVIGGVNYGFMLAQDGKGRYQWSVVDTEVQSFQATASGYGAYIPGKQIMVQQSDWRGGFGQLFYDETAKFNDFGGVDSRWKDKLILGPGVTTTTITGSASLTGAAIKMCEHKSQLYLLTVRYLYWWNNSSTIWVQVHDFGGDYCTDMISLNSVLYVALGANGKYQYCANPGVLATSSLVIGPAATDRANSFAAYTVIDLASPADYTGTIGTVEIWAATDLTGCKVGTFYKNGSGDYVCRAVVTIGAVTAGSKQTFTVSLAVQAGDYLGCYFSAGTIEEDPTGGSGFQYLAGDQTGGAAATYTEAAGGAISLHGIYSTGTTAATWFTSTTYAGYKFASSNRYLAIKTSAYGLGWSKYPEEVGTPAFTANLQAIAGNVDNGNHTYKVLSTINGSYYVLATSGVVATNATHGQVFLSGIPLGSISLGSQIASAVKVYRLNVAGDVWGLLSTLTEGDDPRTLLDNSSDASIATGGITAASMSTTPTFAPWGVTVIPTSSGNITTVGDGNTSITSLTPYGNSVMIGKEDGLWTVVCSTAVLSQVTTDFQQASNSVNFTKACVFQDRYYFNIGNMGLFAYDGSTMTYIGMDLLAPNMASANLYSAIGALTPSHDFLYVILTSTAVGNPAGVCTLRIEDIDGSSDWRWHGLTTISSFDVPACGWISPLQATNRRLWIAGLFTTGSVNKPRYIILPIVGATPDKDSAYVFDTDAKTLATSNYDCGFRADAKIFLAVDILCTVPSGNVISLKHDVDGSGTWVAMIGGNITASGLSTRYFFTDATGPATGVTGRYVKLQITMDSDAATETPVIQGIGLRAILRSKKVKQFNFVVRIGENVRPRGGVMDLILPATRVTQLRNADDPATQTGVVTLTDLDGTTHSVVINNLQEVVVGDETNQVPERHFAIQATEVIVA